MIVLKQDDIATLFCLTKEQWERYIATVPNIPIEASSPWWLLQRKGDVDNYFVVHVDGVVDALGGRGAWDSTIGIRPAVTLKTEAILRTINAGSENKMMIDDTPFTVIEDGIALCDWVMAHDRYDNISKRLSKMRFWRQL